MATTYHLCCPGSTVCLTAAPALPTKEAGSLNLIKHHYSIYFWEQLAANKFPGQKKRRPRRFSYPLSFQSSIIFFIFLLTKHHINY